MKFPNLLPEITGEPDALFDELAAVVLDAGGAPAAPRSGAGRFDPPRAEALRPRSGQAIFPWRLAHLVQLTLGTIGWWHVPTGRVFLLLWKA